MRVAPLFFHVVVLLLICYATTVLGGDVVVVLFGDAVCKDSSVATGAVPMYVPDGHCVPGGPVFNGKGHITQRFITLSHSRTNDYIDDDDHYDDGDDYGSSSNRTDNTNNDDVTMSEYGYGCDSQCLQCELRGNTSMGECTLLTLLPYNMWLQVFPVHNQSEVYAYPYSFVNRSIPQTSYAFTQMCSEPIGPSFVFPVGVCTKAYDTYQIITPITTSPVYTYSVARNCSVGCVNCKNGGWYSTTSNCMRVDRLTEGGFADVFLSLSPGETSTTSSSPSPISLSTSSYGSGSSSLSRFLLSLPSVSCVAALLFVVFR